MPIICKFLIQTLDESQNTTSHLLATVYALEKLLTLIGSKIIVYTDHMLQLNTCLLDLIPNLDSLDRFSAEKERIRKIRRKREERIVEIFLLYMMTSRDPRKRGRKKLKSTGKERRK